MSMIVSISQSKALIGASRPRKRRATVAAARRDRKRTGGGSEPGPALDSRESHPHRWTPHQGRMNGAVAQLGERRVRNAKVRGSIPLGSTIHYRESRISVACAPAPFPMEE